MSREIAKLQQHFKSQESHGLIDWQGTATRRQASNTSKLHEKKHGDLLTDPEEVRANAARGIINFENASTELITLKLS